MAYEFAKITVLAGYYGCGKTNLAANLALKMCNTGRVAVVDIDTVNPYFRTADFKEEFEKRGIRLIATEYANTNLDIPVLNFDIAGIADTSDYMIIDAGGGSDGAAALGRYRSVLMERSPQLLYVFNMYRGLGVKETAEIFWEIESACKMKFTALVNNSNLGAMTVPEDIVKTEFFEGELSRVTGLPVAMRCVPDAMPKMNSKDFLAERIVRMPWENECQG